MNNSAKGNMYEVTLAETQELFAAYLSGNNAGLVCIVSTADVGPTARAALESSMAALGYGRGACAYATLCADGAAEEGASLDAQALFLLLEGLDPLGLIVADDQAATVLGQAYRQEVPLDAPCRLLGRNAVTFRSFPAMLDKATSKQAAWKLLKKLPKLGDRP